MITINLLPWREQQRKVYNNIFYSYLLVIMLVIIMGYLFLWFKYYNNINNLQDNNVYLKQELDILSDNINRLDFKIKHHNKMLNKVIEFDKIKSATKYLLPILRDISRVFSVEAFLTSLIVIDNKLELQGISDSNNILTTLSKSLERFSWCSKIESSEINNYKFKLQIIIC